MGFSIIACPSQGNQPVYSAGKIMDGSWANNAQSTHYPKIGS